MSQARDQWVKQRALEIQNEAARAGDCCSQDHATVTALNEFYGCSNKVITGAQFAGALLYHQLKASLAQIERQEKAERCANS